MIGEGGEQLGLMSLADAKEYAYSRDLDLVLMAANATPPVCKAMNYGKYCFDRTKREKEARKNQQTSKVKEIQLSCRIDVHDFETRTNQAIKFLQGGDKVRAVVRFKGREMAHTDIGYAMLQKFVEACKDYGTTDKKPVMEGRIASVILSPVKNK
ncbi:MAG: translation initiation factor IF-3 [Clostridia bacterium]|nr:translation initiation factor IF-3 [Clostridia bacterium]